MANERTEWNTSSDHEVRVRLFGQFELENHLGRVAEGNPRTVNLSWPLLKYLLVNRGREVDQDELLGTIWPERYGPEAENAARVRLNRLRAYLKPLDLSGRHGLVLYHERKYALNLSYDIRTDADEFDGLMAGIRRCPPEDPRGLELCGRALELYRGPYLKDTKRDFWFDAVQKYYSEEFSYLAFNTADRILSVGNDKCLPLLSGRALELLPADLELHKAILNCYAHFGHEAERKRHTVQLMRADVIAGWLSSM